MKEQRREAHGANRISTNGGGSDPGGDEGPDPTLRILYVIDSLASGGAQRQVVELAKFFRRVPGAEVIVLVYRPEDFYEEDLVRAEVPVARIIKRQKFDPAFPIRLARFIAASRPTIVHAFLPNPCLWTLCALRLLPRKRRPVFIAAERSSLIATDRVLRATQRLVYRNCDAITINAECTKAELRDKLGIDPMRIHYLPNGIDLAQWDEAAQEPPPWPIEADRFHLALVGGYRPEKNHAIVLDALANLPPETTRNWRVWFIGYAETGSPYADRIRRQIEEKRLGQMVRMMPDTRQIAAVVSRMHGLLLPSEFEGFPNVALEAMALGVPVIATSVGDIPNLIEDGKTGFILSRNDATELGKTMLRLASFTDAERSTWSLRARKHVEDRFTLDHVGELHLQLYRKLAEMTLPGESREGSR